MLTLYWAAQYPPVHSVLPHLIGTTNTVAGLLSVVLCRQSARQARAKVAEWWSHHAVFMLRLTLQLGKKGELPPP